jgi:hypothetical protein
MGWCLERIIIYPAVKTIHNGAFKRCDYLKTVKISGEIEKFMPCDAYGKWKCGQWDYHQGALRTDSFLVRCSIAKSIFTISLDPSLTSPSPPGA